MYVAADEACRLFRWNMPIGVTTTEIVLTTHCPQIVLWPPLLHVLQTSFIKALAQYTKRSVISIPLTKINTNQELM